MVFFIWVIVVLVRHAKGTAKRTKQTITSKQVLRILFSIRGVLFLFGLTWGFFILTFSVPGLRETFQILFTVFNSLQGFFIFTFIFFTEGFGYWKELLPCKKHKPSKSTQPQSAPGTKSTNTPNILPRQEKHASENLYLNTKSSEIYTNKKADLMLSSNEVSSTELVSVDTSYSGDQIKDDILHLNNNQEHSSIITAGCEQQDLEERFKKQIVANTGDTIPLNVLVRRYSTKNYKQHHVEEMKVEFFDEEIQ